jgi:hypothetical protein
MYTIMGLESIMMKWLIKGDKRVARGGGNNNFNLICNAYFTFVQQTYLTQ